MSATGAGYDYSPTTFSPDGRVFQVEYASKAVDKSGTSVGIRCKDGVVLGNEKIIGAKMMVRSSNRRVFTIDKHAGMTLSGLAADARQIVNQARSESADYKDFFGTEITGPVLSQRMASFVHSHTLYWWLRPFGCTVLMASYDELHGPQLYQIEPAGTCYRHFAATAGKHSRPVKTELEKIDFEAITCREAVKEVARIIYKVHDDVKDRDFKLELSWVCDESERLHVRVPEDIANEAVEAAKEAKRQEELVSDSDDDSD